MMSDEQLVALMTAHLLGEFGSTSPTQAEIESRVRTSYQVLAEAKRQRPGAGKPGPKLV